MYKPRELNTVYYTLNNKKKVQIDILWKKGRRKKKFMEHGLCSGGIKMLYSWLYYKHPNDINFHVKILLHFYWIIINFLLLIILTGRLFDVQDFRCWLIIHHIFSWFYDIWWCSGLFLYTYISLFLTNLHKHQTKFNLFNLLLNKITIIIRKKISFLILYSTNERLHIIRLFFFYFYFGDLGLMIEICPINHTISAVFCCRCCCVYFFY